MLNVCVMDKNMPSWVDINIRYSGDEKNVHVDDDLCGGGAGMVMQTAPISDV